MIVDFRRKTSHFTTVNIQRSDIEVVESYKFLGVHLNNKLDWTDNTNGSLQEGPESPPPAEETEVLQSVQGSPQDFL